MHTPPGPEQRNTGPNACYGWPRTDQPDPLRINHYLRSVEDFSVKLKHHFVDSDKYKTGIEGFLDRDYNEELDESALRYVPSVTWVLDNFRNQEHPRWWSPTLPQQCFV
mmetsp:Transcript_1932/g.4129  ORF Transcript_1932/g.4129 Transcript_1932/m.4129 type:complete len:109 (+) Transcript_1932:720-1046(+)